MQAPPMLLRLQGSLPPLSEPGGPSRDSSRFWPSLRARSCNADPLQAVDGRQISLDRIALMSVATAESTTASSFIAAPIAAAVMYHGGQYGATHLSDQDWTKCSSHSGTVRSFAHCLPRLSTTWCKPRDSRCHSDSPASAGRGPCRLQAATPIQLEFALMNHVCMFTVAAALLTPRHCLCSSQTMQHGH